MSGFYVLALLAIWALLTKWLWRGSRRLLGSKFGNRGVRVALVVAVAVLWLGGTFWEVAGKKMYWDTRVRKLCAIDGGIKVYEMVVLPAKKFDKWGMVNFYRPTKGEDALGPEYLFENETHYYRQGNPDMRRDFCRIIRRIDGKVLGEVVRYARRGGDMPGPWHDSSFACPEEAGIESLIRQIFIKQ